MQSCAQKVGGGAKKVGWGRKKGGLVAEGRKMRLAGVNEWEKSPLLALVTAFLPLLPGEVSRRGRGGRKNVLSC